ncbi:MAG: hypothetical protein IJJ68_07500 [Prevotella sp.]|jgi:hypothetical protein|nr:hypothetical protein [Prevotella sp.]
MKRQYINPCIAAVDILSATILQTSHVNVYPTIEGDQSTAESRQFDFLMPEQEETTPTTPPEEEWDDWEEESI